MKKTVPDEQRIQTILDLICALDGRIMKVERDGNTLIVYANIQSYEDAASPADTDADTDDYTDYAECYQTCEDYIPLAKLRFGHLLINQIMCGAHVFPLCVFGLSRG